MQTKRPAGTRRVGLLVLIFCHPQYGQDGEKILSIADIASVSGRHVKQAG
jgi:hypothetical protein